MSNLLSTRNLTFSAGTKRLFTEVSFSIDEGDKVALVGHNGSGKSSLFRLIDGSDAADGGEIARRRGLRLAAVEQFLPDELNELNLHEAVLQHLPQAERDQRTFEAEMILGSLGFSDFEHTLRVRDLSGGQQNRLMFARAIAGEPELVLFDEPTNHLDLATIQIFERYLNTDLGCAFILVSHDREFLDAVTRRTLILRDERMYRFDLPFSAARHALLESDIAAVATRAAEEKKLKALQASAKRLATWGKVFDNEKFSRRAKSMEKRVARMEAQKTFVTRGSGLRLQLDAGDTRANRALLIEDLDVRPPFADSSVAPLFRIEQLIIRPGDRIALLGANGVGKTSLITRLVRHFREHRDDTTHIAFSPQAMLGYYDQELREIDLQRSTIDFLRKSTDSNEREIRSALINAGFAYADHARPVHVLSGGERARVLFVCLHLQMPNFLILDEPTNHIDIEGKENLEAQILESGATVLITSHDRRFVDNIAARFVSIEDGTMSEIHDPEDFYARLLERSEKKQAPSAQPNAAPRASAAAHDVLERLVELERKLDEDLARKKRHQKPQLQEAWRREIEDLSRRL